MRNGTGSNLTLPHPTAGANQSASVLASTSSSSESERETKKRKREVPDENAGIRVTAVDGLDTTAADDDSDMKPFVERGLGEIGVLFIPFEAAIQHYKRNATNGIEGFKLAPDRGKGPFPEDGKPFVPMSKAEQEKWDNPKTVAQKVTLVKAKELTPLTQSDISKQLTEIVKQECENVRNMQRSSSENSDNSVDMSKLTAHQREIVTQAQKETKHYPDIIFLSENPMKENDVKVLFPDVIDTGQGVRYIKKQTLDTSAMNTDPLATKKTTVASTNEMAVYVTESMDQRDKDPNDALSISSKILTRTPDSSLYQATKDEYMLKVTLSQEAGQSFTVAGVHLRATLTGLPNPYREGNANPRGDAEMKALEAFCAANEIQLMVGDFNMDLQGAEGGGRGVLYDGSSAHQPQFLVGWPDADGRPKAPTAADEVYHQQYSSSNNKKHYMGFFQADRSKLRPVGTSLYGRMGASGSRHLASGFYSDHPSIYLRTESDRLTPEAEKKKAEAMEQEAAGHKRRKVEIEKAEAKLDEFLEVGRKRRLEELEESEAKKPKTS